MKYVFGESGAKESSSTGLLQLLMSCTLAITPEERKERTNLKTMIILLCCTAFSAVAESPDQAPTAWWRFDEVGGNHAMESISQSADSVLGNFKYVEGMQGNGLKFDGFSARIIRTAKRAPAITSAFTIEAWVAPQAYPYNWCAIVNQEFEHQRGYFFGIDAEGHLGLQLAISRQWRECVSTVTIPFMAWTHVAATFDPDKGILLYINGQVAGQLAIKGTLLVDIGMNLEIGRNQQALPPSSLNRAGKVRALAPQSFDGIIDELKIYKRCLPAAEINDTYKKEYRQVQPPLVWRKLPKIVTDQNRFGAYFTKLTYDPDWDAIWPVDEYPDVVVTFAEHNYSMVFWHGTNYNMNLVTENGRWVGDQSAEGGGGNVAGCCEHMSDKQNRYSHIRIIENGDARVVVHWRYALTDIFYRIADTDPITDWGTWADEYYTIYPDGIAVRHFAVHGPDDRYSITEPAALNNPGQKTEDNVDLRAVTLASLAGESRSFSWEKWPSDGRIAADFINPVPNPQVCVVNFKSTFKPFYIYEPVTRIIPYGGGIREVDQTYSHFPVRNHWPVSMIPCDGRFALAPDRVTSSAIVSPEPPMARRSSDGAVEGRFIMGLGDQSMDQLISIARSWLQPPRLSIDGGEYSYTGYDRNQRAFVLTNNSGKESNLEAVIDATPDSPLENLTLVVKNWGNREPLLKIDGQSISRGEAFRYQHRFTLQGCDLIIWIKITARQLIHVAVASSEQKR